MTPCLTGGFIKEPKTKKVEKKTKKKNPKHFIWKFYFILAQYETPLLLYH